jgi:hypothetical protein
MTSTKQSCYLYTLVARCRVTGKGKPLAWMITNNESQYPIRYWLQWLRDAHGYQPSKVMIDNSDAEIAAINMAYNLTSDSGNNEEPVFNNTVKIFICHWHLLKAWKKAILVKVSPVIRQSRTMAEKKEMRDEALQLLSNLLNAEDEITFELHWETFELWCRENDAEWDTGSLFLYMEKEYYAKRDNWSRCWREVYIQYNKRLQSLMLLLISLL